MTRITPRLISALFVLGCGSGAMASPAHGQWTDNSDFNGPTQAAPQPQSAGDDDSPPPGAQSGDQGGYQTQGPSQNQDQDEDTVETQTRQAGQTRLGVMVMALTPELRRFFGITSDRGVLIARVEPGSAASRAGVQVGDVLTRVANQPVRTGNDVLQALAAHSGERIRVAVVRQGRMVRLSAQLPGQRSQTDDDNDNDRI